MPQPLGDSVFYALCQRCRLEEFSNGTEGEDSRADDQTRWQFLYAFTVLSRKRSASSSISNIPDDQPSTSNLNTAFYCNKQACWLQDVGAYLYLIHDFLT